MRTLALYLLLGLIWLGYASTHRPVHHYAMLPKPTTLKQRQAKALQELYSISDDEIAKPVVLWEP